VRVVPPERQGYSNVAFSANGQLIIAGSLADYQTKVYSFHDGACIGAFSGCDTVIASHPEGELFATVRNDQAGALIRFVRVTNTFHCYLMGLSPPQLNVSGMSFSPAGDMLAVIGGNPNNYADWPIVVSVHAFPSCRMIFKVHISLPSKLPSWANVWATPLIEHVAFSPDGLRLLVPKSNGYISELSTTTGQEVGSWKAHDGLVNSIHVRHFDGIVVTAGVDEEIKVWQCPDTSAYPSKSMTLTKAFLRMTSIAKPFELANYLQVTNGE
jgi:WD40 repeat protein